MNNFINIVPVNPFISLANNYSLEKNTKEKFEERIKPKGSFLFDFFAILVFMFWVILLIVLFITFIRFLLVAFKCGFGQGLLALCFTYPYVAWKFTDILRNYCTSVESVII